MSSQEGGFVTGQSRPTTEPLPDRLPLIPLRDLVFFPPMVLPLLIGRPRSVAALSEAREGDGRLVVVAQKDAAIEDPTAGDLHRIGTLVQVLEVSSLEDGTARVVLEGIQRVRVERYFATSGLYRVRARMHGIPPPSAKDEARLAARVRAVEKLFQEYAKLHEQIPEELPGTLLQTRDRQRMLDLLAGHLLVPADDKQTILGAESQEDALERIQNLLVHELQVLRIEGELDDRMRRQMDEDRRKFYLKEQRRAINEELGEEGEGESDELERAVREASLPDHAGERAKRELGRLRKLNPTAPEAAVIRTYLEWVLALPWTLTETVAGADVAHAEEVLDAEHFGLEEVKDRVLDHIAVLSLVGELRGPILCLVGPPGVGKTSLGRSIARALGREFVRVSLGGVRDEAEIRGHRRTYVGALPGKVLQGLRRCGSRNAVFLLDEVDKVSRDFHGDPGAALLEVLDPEQNSTFTDHYLELEFDLSDVLFIATANTLTGIPEPLRDRMEVIRIPGYLDSEKRAIVRRFLLPRQLERHGIAERNVKVEEETVQQLITAYTREAGVRELDRLVSKLARKVARGIADRERQQPLRRNLRPEDLYDLLGPPPFRFDGPVDERDRIGIANGLAWTPAGGQVLDVEVVVVPGSGQIQLTGTLGDVMKESAVAAITFARTRARKLALAPRFHRDVDVHIHIPEGATPKDGPSAGTTIAAALISALTGCPTRGDVAMTGEITLRGRVLPVGGIREKAVAAVRAGIQRMVLPEGNESEIGLLPEEVRERVEFVPVGTMDDVLTAVLAPHPGLALEEGPGLRTGFTADTGIQISQ